MDKRYLPSLKNLQIKNFSLYPGDLNFTYDFVEGINLIIGGNGVGKTTFLNVLKYALVGLYKKGLDVKRREFKQKEYRYDKRVTLPYNYFSNRMDELATYNSEAEVTLTFKIDNLTFEVTRNLYVPTLQKAIVYEGDTKTEIEGKIISQYDFDILFSDKVKNENELQSTLQWKYEEAVGRASNHEFFENIIFLVNDILFFSESRKTIMWDSYIQNKISSKYFIDPKLDEKKEKAELDGKYQDSLARHKSEDIRAIKKIIENVQNIVDVNKPFKDLIIDIENKKKEADNYFKDLVKIQEERDGKEVIINKINTENNQLHRQLEDLENQKRIEEQNIFTDLFKKVNPKYYDFLKFLKSSGDCPLCNNELPELMFNKILNDDAHCMMCGNNLKNPQLTSGKLDMLITSIKNVQLNIRRTEKEIIKAEDDLKKLDNRFRYVTVSLNNAQSKLRKAEFAVQKFQNSGSDNKQRPDTEFVAMKARIEELEIEKEIAQGNSKKSIAEANDIIKQIDSQRLESREKLSSMFNQFGSKFLGVKCELVYEDPKDGQGKRYLPRIGGIERLQEEELSESQRFFIDQSFRMSLLNFFNSSSFFMCETPDSSLDISYEKNAAKVFLEYIKQPNELIITSNLNNSVFLEYLIEESKGKFNYINLLKIGKQSVIQSDSEDLLKTSNKIESIINGTRNK